MLLATIGVPALLVGALATVQPVESPASSVAPTTAPLASIDLVCPAGGNEPVDLLVTRATVPTSEGRGEVSVGSAANPLPITVPAGESVAVPAGRQGGSTVVSGRGSTAPGLAALVATPRPLAGVGCAVPQPIQWFVGLGAGPTHSSRIELTNPDDASAVADIAIYSEEGVLDVPALRGVAVGGDSSVLLELAELLPRRGQLAATVTISRGRLGVGVRDRDDELGTRQVREEWAPAQAAPARVLSLLGLPGAGQHQLIVVNPGPDQAQVDVAVLTSAAPYAPTGLEPLQIPPNAVAVVSVSDVVAEALLAEGPDGLGLELESSVPVAAALRSIVDGDLSFTPAAVPAGHTWQLVPELAEGDRARVIVHGGHVGARGTVRVFDRAGRPLVEESVDLGPRAATTVPVPRAGAIVEVVAPDGVIGAGLSITGRSGNLVLAMREVVATALIGDVRPSLR